MANLFGGKTPLIGLDLGSGYLKIAQLKETTKGLNLVNIGLLPTPKNAIENAKIVNPDEIAEGIRTLLRMYSFIGKRVVTSVSGQLVTVRTLTVDKLPEKELDEVIKWEVQKLIPFKIEEASFDYQILGTLPESQGEKLSVIAAAASLDIINSIVSAIKLAKLEPVAIEIESFAELRLLDYTYKDKYQNYIIILINSGHTFTNINIIEDGILRFTRTIPFGGRNLIRIIQDGLKINEKDAETYLVTACDLRIEKYPKDSETYRLTEIIIPQIEEFALEIRRSIIYYQGLPNFSGKNFLIILGGGASRLKGLVDFMRSYLKVEVILDDLLLKGVVFNPKLFTEDYLREMSPFFTVAVGLAMREAFEKIEKSKLKPGGKRNEYKNKSSSCCKKKRRAEDTNLIIIFIFFVIVLALVYFFYNARVNSLNKTLATIQANINKLKDMETLKNEKIKSDGLLSYYINTITKLTKNQTKFSDFFNTLSSEFPKYAYITSLDVDLDTKVIKITGETSDFYNLGRLIDYLKNSKAISNVYLSNFSRQEITQTGESKVTFTLIGIIQTGGTK